MSVKAILIEDSAEIRQAITPALSELADVHVAAFAEEACEAVQLLIRQPCELVILDLFLRKGSGLDVLAHMRANGYRTPVVVLTNYATQNTRERCLTAGAEAVFDKSTELDAFFEYCLEFSDQKYVRDSTLQAPF